MIGGFATWFDVGPGFYAAAGPDLRHALGPGWRHTLIEVQGPARARVVVELTDSCACGSRHGVPTILDLSPAAFRELAPLSAGIVAVSIELAPELPRTDTDVRMMLEVRDDEVYR